METNGPRRSFEQATAFFVATVARVGPEQWEQPALGEWSIRDLVGHTRDCLRNRRERASGRLPDWAGWTIQS